MNPRARNSIVYSAIAGLVGALVALTATAGKAQDPFAGPWNAPPSLGGWPQPIQRVAFDQPAPVAVADPSAPPSLVSDGGLTLSDGFAEAPVVSEGSAVADGWNCPGVCPSSWYGSAAFAYFSNNSSENVTRSRRFAIDDFDFVEGMQITFGKMFDCTEGWEVIYTGPFQWRTGASFNDPFNVVNGVGQGGNLNSTWVLIDPAQGGLVPAEVSAFNNATFHSQRYEASLNSIEFHSKTWGWDVFAVTLGVRYLRYDEEYAFTGINRLGQTGVFQTTTDNNLLGPQLGVEFRYPFLPGWSISSRYKGGVYANFIDTNTQLVNNGAAILNNGADDVALGAMAEIGTRVSRNFGNRASVFAGYDLYYIYGLALAGEQTSNVLVRSSGRSLEDEGDIWLSGITAGVELSW